MYMANGKQLIKTTLNITYINVTKTLMLVNNKIYFCVNYVINTLYSKLNRNN